MRAAREGPATDSHRIRQPWNSRGPLTFGHGSISVVAADLEPHLAPPTTQQVPSKVQLLLAFLRDALNPPPWETPETGIVADRFTNVGTWLNDFSHSFNESRAMTQMLQTSGGRVAYETFGVGGTPIVAVPGIGDTRASYRALAPMLVQAGYTVYAMDLRGHGGSDTSFGSYTSENIGNDVVALLDALDLRDAVLIGNSVGAAAIVHASLVSDRAARCGRWGVGRGRR